MNIECSLDKSTRHHERPTGFRGAVFFCLLLICLPAPLLAQPPKWDISIFRSINNSHSAFLNETVGANDYTVLPLAILTPVGFAGAGLYDRNAYTFDTGVLLGMSEASAYVIYYVLKNLIIKRERPHEALTGVNTMHLDTADKYSMPSGHATAAFAIATMLTLRYPKPYVYIPAYAWAAFVAYGRVYMGLHYPSDVLAGAILGSASAFAIHCISQDVTKWREKVLGDKLGIILTVSPVPAVLSLRIDF